MQDETRGFQEGERIAKLSVWTLLALGIIEIIFSQVSGSVALLADGIDSMSDALVSFFVWTGLRFARRKPSRRFQYGYYKVESFTALITAIALVGVAVFIFLRSYRAFTDPEHRVVLPIWALVVLFGAGSVSLYRALQMRQIANRFHILSLKTDARNSIKDASASFIAFGSVLFASFGLHEVDALGGMLVAFYILTVAYVALREASLVLLDAFHEPELTREIESLIKSNSHVRGIRELRLRRAGPFIVGTLEIIVDGTMTVSQVHTVSTELENSVKNRIAGLRTLVVRAIPSP